MRLSNILLGENIEIDTSSSINNIQIFNNVKVAKNCSLFGSESNLLVIGNNTYIGMNTLINGYSSKVNIGAHVSIAPNVCILSDSGPNASQEMQEYYPLDKGNISIGDHSWIGVNSTIMPNVTIGSYCVVAANSLVKDSFDDFSVIAGSPAKLIKKLVPNVKN